jgi:hypothetical protein
VSRIRAAVVAVVITLVALVIPASPAHADDWGNGNWTCDYYEICFNGLSQSTWNYEYGVSHMFYYGNMHHDQEAICDAPASYNCILLMDAANGFWNRDSTCSVTLWDVDGYGNWYRYGTYARGFRGDVGGYRNNGHSRC